MKRQPHPFTDPSLMNFHFNSSPGMRSSLDQSDHSRPGGQKHTAVGSTHHQINISFFSYKAKSFTPCLKNSWLLQPTPHVRSHHALQLTLWQAVGKGRAGRHCSNRDTHIQPRCCVRGPHRQPVLTPGVGAAGRFLGEGLM